MAKHIIRYTKANQIGIQERDTLAEAIQFAFDKDCAVVTTVVREANRAEEKTVYVHRRKPLNQIIKDVTG